jgi:adenine/guanine phosphoribosyltransferase-like PRPP-binding protein
LSDKVDAEEVLKNSKFMVFNLLRILKFFYSFKELEKRLNVPSQVLWRYVTLRVTPEKETAQRILARIKEQRLVEEVVSSAISRKGGLWALFSNPGILELAALKLVEEFRKGKVEVVLSAPDPYSAALAAVASTYLRAKLCIPSRTPYSDNVLTESYQVAPGVIDVAAIPRECIPRKSGVLVVTVTTANPSHIKAAVNLVVRRGAKIAGVFALTGTKQVIQEYLAATKPAQNPKIIVLVETGSELA